jgi:phosphotriesterase-related protein
MNVVIDEVDVACEELKWFRRAGGVTLVDQSCDGLGRNILGLKKAAEASGVHVVAATGLYRECLWPEYAKTESADQIARRMISEIRDGIEGTGIRAGIIAEMASEFGVGKLSPNEVKSFTAAAYAQRETGLPISTHCWAGELAIDQIDLLMKHGVPANKILIGHLAVVPAVKDRIFDIAQRGVMLGFDCIGYWYENLVEIKDPLRAAWVREFIDRGHLRQILLSQDVARRLQLRHYHGHGYDYLLREFVPILRQARVTDAEIHTLLVENPRAYLAGDTQ